MTGDLSERNLADNADSAGEGRSYSAYRPHSRWPYWLAALVVLATLIVAAFVAQAVLILMEAGGIDAIHWQLTAAFGASQITCIAITWWVAGLRGDRRALLLALKAPAQGARSYFYAYLAMLLIFGSLSAVLWLIQPDLVTRDLTPFAGLIESPAWWLAVIVIVIGAPVMEELMFRGFLFPALARSKLGNRGAAVVSSVGWAALHAGYSVAGLAEVFLAGLYLSWMLLKTGSLRVPIFCHAAYNSSVLLMLMVVDIPVAAPG